MSSFIVDNKLFDAIGSWIIDHYDEINTDVLLNNNPLFAHFPSNTTTKTQRVAVLMHLFKNANLDNNIWNLSGDHHYTFRRINSSEFSPVFIKELIAEIEYNSCDRLPEDDPRWLLMKTFEESIMMRYYYLFNPVLKSYEAEKSKAWLY